MYYVISQAHLPPGRLLEQRRTANHITLRGEMLQVSIDTCPQTQNRARAQNRVTEKKQI
jgi:hypothetical protein